MKLSFSTLGCPDWTFDEICERAQRYGYQGIGIRGIMGEMDLTKIDALSAKNLPATREKLRAAGLGVGMLGTSCKFTSAVRGERNKNLADGKAAIDLASALGAKLIRVYGGAIAEGVSRDDARAWVVENLVALGDYCGTKGVMIGIETHDAFTDTSLVREILERTNHPAVGALWDVHHPYRISGQSMQTAWENIGRFVIHTHFKDSFIDPAEKLGYKYCLLGEGDVPNLEALQILKDNGYDGYLSLEWEKAWHPYLPDASVAFPQYVTKMGEYLKRLR